MAPTPSVTSLGGYKGPSSEGGGPGDGIGSEEPLEARGATVGAKGVWGRHATSVLQGGWFSVGIGPVSEATQ